MPILRVKYNLFGQINLFDLRRNFDPLKQNISYFFVYIHEQQDMCSLNIKSNNKILFLSTSKQHLKSALFAILAYFNPS
jgi:hypothetical protein